MGMLSTATARLKDLAGYIRGSNPTFVLQQAAKTGALPDVSDQYLIQQDQNWPNICARIVASCVAQVPQRLFVTRGTGEGRARTRTGSPGRPISKSSADYAYLMAHPVAGKRADFVNAQEVEEIFDHPYLDLIRQANDDNNGFDTMYLTSIYLDHTGDAYWNIENGSVGIPQRMFVMLSQNIRIVPGIQELIKGYIYGSDASNRVGFEPDEVIHFKWPNPDNVYYGKGRLEGILSSVTRDVSMDRLERGMLDNSGRPDTLLGYKQKLDKADRKSLQAEWDRLTRTKSHTGGVYITSHDPVIHQLGQSLKDMSFPMGRKFNRDQCANSYGVPIAMLDSKDFGKASSGEAMRGFAKFTIRPKLTLIDQKINEKIIPRYNGSNRLISAFDNPVPEDIELKLKTQEQHLLTGVLTPNEVRAEQGLPPYDGGDIPLTMIGQLSAIDAQPMQRSYKIQAKAEGDGPPLSAPSAEFPGGLSGGEGGPLTSTEAKLAAETRKTMVAMGFEVDARMANALKVSDLEGVNLVDNIDDIAIDFANRSEPIMGKAIVNGGKAAQRGLGMDVSFWIEQEDAQAVIRDRALKFSNSVVRNKSDEIQAALSKAINEGQPIDELTASIKDLFDGSISRAKAEEVARTEISRATNIGQRKLWETTDFVTGASWDALNDSCPFCLDMDGKEVNNGESFFDVDGPPQEVDFKGETISLSHSFDTVWGPPLHPHCRCGLKPVIEE